MADRTTAQKPNNSAQGARRRLRLWLLVVAAFLGWAGFTLFGQMEQAGAKQAQINELQKAKAETEKQHEKLKLEMTRLNDPEYIGQLARRDQHMYLPGETPYNVTEEANP